MPYGQVNQNQITPDHISKEDGEWVGQSMTASGIFPDILRGCNFLEDINLHSSHLIRGYPDLNQSVSYDTGL